jgi:hypothetical protein
MPTLMELTKLRLDELSGVDAPANLSDGWLIAKSRTQGIAETYFKAAATATVASDTEKRLTLAPIYAPDQVDAHGEFVSVDELERAAFEFAKSGNKRLLLQHGDVGAQHVGDILSVFPWPYEVTLPITKAGERPRDVRFPAGTVFAWVRWDQDAWKTLVKTGKLNGYSMGGRAHRAPGMVKDLQRMGDLAKAGRVLSAQNVKDLRDCIAVLTELVAREPRAAEAAGIAKCKDGFLVTDAAAQEVYYLTPDRIEVLGP